ncbi:MAG: hypothetical protein GQ581_09935 [Methyloprofundus sp.]|nr:hypothetical protein [Methyloprofundus sp.]
MANDNSIKKQLSATAINALKPSGKIKDVGEYSGLYVSCSKFGPPI